MSRKKVVEMGWGRKASLSVDVSFDTLDTVIGSHIFDDMGMEFLNMYLAFKRLEAKEASEKTEQERHDAHLKMLQFLSCKG